jgi:hypothetical protein
MPREDEHHLKATRNEAFAESLDLSDPVKENWAVVATFYAALHYVEAYFARYNVTCGKHDERFRQFMGDDRIKHAFSSYKYLYDLSLTARYYCSGLPDKPYTMARPRLAAVKKQIEHALANEAKAGK